MATMESLAQAPEASALTNLIDSSSMSGNPLGATTIQILHNLQHQHLWTSLQIHDVSVPANSIPDPASLEPSARDKGRTIISGIPPQRVYTHPDEQLYLLENGLREDDLRPERIFVIPTSQGQYWSLRRMAGVFDALSNIAVVEDSEKPTSESVDSDKAKKLEEYYERKEKSAETKEWGSRRMLLAMVDKGMGGDGTVVYYVVQEGEVKPRQN